MHKLVARHACLYAYISLNLFSASPSAAQPAPPGPGQELAKGRSGNEACRGVVTQYLLNQRGDVDGLFLADDTQINLPPHMGSELVKAIKVGERVSAKGIRQNRHVFTAWQIIGDKTKIAVVDRGLPRPPGSARPVATSKSMQARASVKAFLYGPKGDVNGFLLSDRTIVRMPPETAFSFSNVLQTGQVISVKGNGTESPLGRCIEATSIGAGGQPVISIYDTDSAKSSKPKSP